MKTESEKMVEHGAKRIVDRALELADNLELTRGRKTLYVDKVLELASSEWKTHIEKLQAKARMR